MVTIRIKLPIWSINKNIIGKKRGTFKKKKKKEMVGRKGYDVLSPFSRSKKK